MSCTDSGPFDGGTYNQPIVNDPQVTGGTFTNPKVSGAELTGNVTLDAAAAKAIMEAVQEQDPVAVADEPAVSYGDDLPTDIIGEDRSVLLGKPAHFIKCGAFMIPVFRAQ